MLGDRPSVEEGHPFSLCAWVDESIALPDDGPGSYVLAAVVADPLACDGIRDKFRALRRGREPRLHWRSEQPRRRTRIADAIADSDLAALVVIGSPVMRSRQERARRCCMERLLFELDDLGVTDALLESRTASLNVRDRDFVAGLRGQRAIGRDLQVAFVKPSDEPMVWIADAIAGAVTASCLGQRAWLGRIERIVTQCEITVR